MVNLEKDIDSQALMQECMDFGEVRAFKYIKPLDSAVVVFNDIRSAIDCKLVMQAKRPVSFGEVCSLFSPSTTHIHLLYQTHSITSILYTL